MDNRETSLQQAAHTFGTDLLHLRKGERLLIYMDQGSDRCVAQAIQNCAEEIGVRTEVYQLGAKAKVADLSRQLTGKMLKGRFDAVCELSEQYFYATLGWWLASLLGSRLYSLAAVDADSFIRCVGQVDHGLMYEFGLTLSNLLKKAKSVQIVTDQGTNIRFRMSPAAGKRGMLSRLRIWEIPWVGSPTGMFTGSHGATFMGGQVAFQGVADTVEGAAVIDGYLWPPREVGPVDVPIVMKIHAGSLVEIAGGSVQAEILSRWFASRDKRVKHFCIGFNPGARLAGPITEAERVFGCIVLGIGRYPFHSDGVFKNPSLWLDDRIVEQDGTFVHEELSILAQDLLRGQQRSGSGRVW